MASREQLMYVGNVCPGYRSTGSGFKSHIGANDSKSCENCEHYEKGKCVVDLFDKVLTSIDQT